MATGCAAVVGVPASPRATGVATIADGRLRVPRRRRQKPQVPVLLVDFGFCFVGAPALGGGRFLLPLCV